jgi:hypothetical protein
LSTGTKSFALTIVQVPAAFREGLVFQVYASQADACELADHAVGVERVAVAGVGIADHRAVDRVADLGQPLHDMARVDQVDVRHAGGAGDAAAGGIQRLEAGHAAQPCRHAVIDARCHDHAGTREHLAQLGCLTHL